MPSAPFFFRQFKLLTLVAIVGLAAPSVSRGDSKRDDTHYIYEGRSPQVPLQPFSLDPPLQSRKAISVAYYAPRPTPRAEPNYSNQDEDSDEAAPSRVGGPTVPGNRALLRGGVAYAPANAPYRVKAAIWAVNSIRHKPYHWGGGHGSFYDSGYDCSGAVSYALHFAGALGQPLPSSDLLHYGEYGRGRWITVYSRHGHTFAIIAGLRLDTTDFRYGGDVGPRWYTEGRSTWGFSARHPAGL